MVMQNPNLHFNAFTSIDQMFSHQTWGFPAMFDYIMLDYKVLNVEP